MNSTGETTRCGFVAILGAPNAGKSTLLNTLIGSKISIVSPKVQTTRTRVLGIFMVGSTQIVFIDTPGIFAPKKRMERAMVHAAWGGAKDADLCLLVIDAQRGLDENAQGILDGLKREKRKAVLVLNKVDLVARHDLLALSQLLNTAGDFIATFMVSALSGDGVADVRDFLAKEMPVGPFLYPEDQISDMPLRLLAAEITREQVFLQLHQELPYAIFVETDQWLEKEDGSIRLDQTIYVQRESQKAIVLGKGGVKIKSIGAKARRELETILGRRAHLFLHVKVKEKWSEDPGIYRAMGLDFNP